MARPAMNDQTPHMPAPTPKPRSTICPYCGARSGNLSRCDVCRGLFDPLSRQATQNAMGPWFIRDEARPHRPGCSYETLVRMIDRGEITLDTVLRGPSTLQFWTLARWCPGVAHRLGVCHSCAERVEPTDPACAKCGAAFRVYAERQHLGLGEIRYIPGRPGPGASDVLGESAPGPSVLAESGTPTSTAGEAEDPETAARLGRLSKQLAVSRRWAVAWSVAFLLLAAVVAGALIMPLLDLEAGPANAWLRKAEPIQGEVRGPNISENAPAILLHNTTEAPGTAPPPVGEDGEEPLTESPPAAESDPGPGSTPGTEDEATRGGDMGGDGVAPAADPRVEAYANLRRLR